MNSDLGVAVAFFSPCGYELPRQHFVGTMDMLRGRLVSVAQVHRTGQQPIPVPDEFMSQVFCSDSTMFYKENLWNLAAAKLDTPKLLFLDSDIRFHPEDWFARVSASLDEADVIQPFGSAEWLSKDGSVFMTLPPAAYEIANGRCPVLSRHHPGFAWGMRRSVFDALGGWYDLFTSGAGDAGFAFALCSNADPELGTRAKKGMLMSGQESYVRYRKLAISLNLRVGYTPGVRVQHLWHGDRENRGYLTRETYFPQPAPDDSHVTRRPDGLLEWAVPAPRAMDYFMARMEDGTLTISHATNHPIPEGDCGGMVREEPNASAGRGRL